MSEITFFTAIEYEAGPKTNRQYLIEKVDSYFYLGGRKARVVEVNGNSHQVKWIDETPSFLSTSLKIASYFSVIIPLILLVAKAVLRLGQDFHEMKSKKIKPISTSTQEFQQQVSIKLAHAVNKIVREVLTTIINSTLMSPQAFVDTQITPRQALLSEMNEKTSKFFKEMMKAVNEELDKVPTLAQSFELLAIFTGDPQVQEKLVQGIALPTIQELLSDLESANCSFT